MKVKGVSFSAYKVKLDVYAFEKLDLFSFLFTQVILDESLNKEEKIVDCLFNLDIKEDLLYLFNNVYYKMIDNKLIEETKEDIFDLKIKDINIDKRFIEYFKQGYFPILNEEVNKEFIYDIINDKLVVSDTLYSDTNLCAIRKDNSDESIETLVNRYKKSLLNVSDCDCVLKNKIVNPYYFEFELKDKDNKYVLQLDNKESVYKDLVSNSLFINDKVLKGDILTNNIYFKCAYGKEELKDYCDYLFVYNKDKEYEVKDNIIYVNYSFDMVDIVDLVNREGYECGVYSLENDELVSTFLKNKVKSISEFKLYLTKNKDKFKTNITKIIELL